MSAPCPECGAAADDGLDCWWRMGAVCAWEHDDPALAALHFFTVACHNLQHPARFTPEALAGLEAAVIEACDHGLDVAALRARMAAATDGATRVLARPPRAPVAREWAMTVADVYAGGSAEGAAGRVRAWAAAVRQGL